MCIVLNNSRKLTLFFTLTHDLFFFLLHISTPAAGGVQAGRRADEGTSYSAAPCSAVGNNFVDVRREESSKYITCASAWPIFSNYKSTSLFFKAFDSSSFSLERVAPPYCRRRPGDRS